MALLGHVSTQMSLRYVHLFDHTVRTEYERSLDLAGLPITDITGTGWKDTPAIKSRLAGGYCLRAPAQGSCPYANICEHCPSFHTDSTHLAVLAAQRIDAQDLAADAAVATPASSAPGRCSSSSMMRLCSRDWWIGLQRKVDIPIGKLRPGIS